MVFDVKEWRREREERKEQLERRITIVVKTRNRITKRMKAHRKKRPYTKADVAEYNKLTNKRYKANDNLASLRAKLKRIQ